MNPTASDLSTIPTAELAAELIRRRQKPAAQPDALTVLSAKLVRRAATCYGLQPSTVIGNGQQPAAARCRYAVWEALRILGHTSPSTIARVFSRDHSTLIHGWRKAASLKVEDPKFCACLDLLLV